jgi:hypothetical protein
MPLRGRILDADLLLVLERATRGVAGEELLLDLVRQLKTEGVGVVKLVTNVAGIGPGRLGG